jgi:hypothetical protein
MFKVLTIVSQRIASVNILFYLHLCFYFQQYKTWNVIIRIKYHFLYSYAEYEW